MAEHKLIYRFPPSKMIYAGQAGRFYMSSCARLKKQMPAEAMLIKIARAGTISKKMGSRKFSGPCPLSSNINENEGSLSRGTSPHLPPTPSETRSLAQCRVIEVPGAQSVYM